MVYPFGNAVNGVAHDGQGRWIAVGASPNDNARSSSDGISWGSGGWTGLSLGLDVAHDQEGRWVTIGWHGGVATSTTAPGGSVWWNLVSYPHDRAVHGVAHDGDSRWVAVGAGATVARSSDGQTWTTVSYPHAGHINTIAADRSAG